MQGGSQEFESPQLHHCSRYGLAPRQKIGGLFLWPLDRDWRQYWRQYVGNRVWLSSDSRHPDGCWSEFAWRFSASRSDVGSGGLVVVGLVLIGVIWVLLVSCLFWLFDEVGVWPRSLMSGYVPIPARL